jgi:hypothetical protein
MTGVDNVPALAALHRCQTHLVAARADTLHAAADLRGARAARAFELAELLADALAFCERHPCCGYRRGGRWRRPVMGIRARIPAQDHPGRPGARGPRTGW